MLRMLRGCCAHAQEQRQLEFAQMDNQITYNEALIDERDQGIAEISQQIGEVNEIFQVSCRFRAASAIACARAGWRAGRAALR